VLAAVTADSRTRMWERVMATPRAAREGIMVAEIGGVAAGFAWTGACRDEGAPESLGELQAINLDPEHWGTGAGSALLLAAHDALAEAGFAEAILWVLPDNSRARRFYEAHGWLADGAERDVELGGGQKIPEVRYARRFADRGRTPGGAAAS
jgi:ribosomal protein S18 acetylase RimI-like enzyme